MTKRKRPAPESLPPETWRLATLADVEKAMRKRKRRWRTAVVLGDRTTLYDADGEHIRIIVHPKEKD